MGEYIHRYIQKSVLKDLERKMVFIGGPRQSGKTTLAKYLCRQAGYSLEERYLNWDAAADRENIIKEQFPAGSGILILDEIHKYSRWRQVVKGLFDKRGDELDILVTGSARLDHYRRGGDSLQGRYHFYRLMPLTFSELGPPDEAGLADLFNFGGFPEPLLLRSEKETRRWSQEYRSRVIQGDLSDLENIMDLGIIENMVIRLPDLVGSPLSLNALREDLQVSHQSVSRWIGMLEKLYMIFRIYPFGAPKIRAVKKEAKHYHMDWTTITDPGARFENMIACHLLKWCYYKQDTEGIALELRYFRDVDKREVDFVIVENMQPTLFIECKLSEKSVALPLKYLKKRFPHVTAIQVFFEGNCDYITKEGIRVCSAHRFLKEFI
ncbi:MAG: ATP-binding protein [Deltaproteobacteria bacterium]|nr:ATP-binding protein [Deltaproteobacteria bacterium]MBW2177445.1 ATP-binding protein [Deltaproteobacteria bacterium]MBW2677861.1 ATP-binding protein [Deltaproteobacteria bacterium]